MNSKTIIWIAFAVWCLICWRWYVCGIKQQCGTAAAAVATTPAIEPADTMPAEPVQHAAPTPNRQTQLAENDINSVQVVELEDRVEIHFPYNSVQKEENAAIDDYLNRLAETLRNSGGKVTIAGHSDGIGDGKSNRALALLRAKNIRRILMTKGVKDEQIKVISYGESKSIASNDTPAGRYKNRRVVIRLD